jgi:hypothetical protein
MDACTSPARVYLCGLRTHICAFRNMDAVDKVDVALSICVLHFNVFNKMINVRKELSCVIQFGVQELQL